MINSLNLNNLIGTPITPKQVIIWDEGKSQQSPINLANAIWAIIINEIMTNRETLEQPNFDNVSNKVRGEIIASIGAYPYKKISTEIGKLGLMEFMASQQINSIPT